MKLERIYYDERWKIWKVEVDMDNVLYVIPLSVVTEFCMSVLARMMKCLTTEAK